MAQLHGLGWLPDIPSHRDYTEEHPEIAPLLSRTRLARRVAGGMRGEPVEATIGSLPPQVDLRSSFSPVEDQGQLGSCTANAAVGLLEYFERRTQGKYTDASRLFVYKTERDLLGWTGDTGAFLRTAMQALVLFGAPPEKYWPYDGRPPATNTRFDVEPSAFCYAFGANFQALKYFRLDPPGTTPAQLLANIKSYLAQGFPSMFGFPVYPEYDHPLPGGLVAYPAPTSRSRGGHANVAAGYDDTITIGGDTGALLVRNSWGPGWGLGGYAWMSYRYVTQGLATDWWTMISAEWVDSGVFS
jgi:C1A family cysteine protease